jgi:hypothetical protein
MFQREYNVMTLSHVDIIVIISSILRLHTISVHASATTDWKRALEWEIEYIRHKFLPSLLDTPLMFVITLFPSLC